MYQDVKFIKGVLYYEEQDGNWYPVPLPVGPPGMNGGRGPRGIQGVQGIQGPVGPAGPAGPDQMVTMLLSPSMDSVVANVALGTGVTIWAASIEENSGDVGSLVIDSIFPQTENSATINTIGSGTGLIRVEAFRGTTLVAIAYYRYSVAPPP